MGENKGKKKLQEKCQKVLNELLKVDDNKYCADCDSKGPRWASWNIGVFLCIRCAGIHRNLGVHISKVKSVNLDAWTPQQVVTLRRMGGNSRARAVYEAELPDNFRRPQNDSSLESFIRAKYEQKKYIAREYIQPSPPSPRTDWERALDDNGDSGGSNNVDESERVTRIIMSEKKINGEGECYKNAEVPQLPKPGTGKGILVSNTAIRNREDIKEHQTKPKPSEDLLGEDNFSNFVSAPPTETPIKNETNNTVSKSEEEDFFNQISGPTGILGTGPPKEKTKLDKDSIMALYSATPANSFGTAWSGNPGANIAVAACNPFPPTNPAMQFYGGVQATVQPQLASRNYWNNIPTPATAAAGSDTYQNRFMQFGNASSTSSTGNTGFGVNSIFPNPFLKNHQ